MTDTVVLKVVITSNDGEPINRSERLILAAGIIEAIERLEYNVRVSAGDTDDEMGDHGPGSD
jgi:hypothetical protein